MYPLIADASPHKFRFPYLVLIVPFDRHGIRDFRFTIHAAILSNQGNTKAG